MDEKEEIAPNNYADWFALYKLCQLINQNPYIIINSSEFGNLLGLSQQTGSRRINELVELNWIKRSIEGKSQKISITKRGANVMLQIYKNL